MNDNKDIEIVLGDINQYPMIQMEEDDEKLNVRVLFTFDNDLNDSKYSYCLLSKNDNEKLHIKEIEEEDLIFCVRHREDDQLEPVDLSADNEENEMLRSAFIQWNVEKNKK